MYTRCTYTHKAHIALLTYNVSGGYKTFAPTCCSSFWCRLLLTVVVVVADVAVVAMIAHTRAHKKTTRRRNSRRVQSAAKLNSTANGPRRRCYARSDVSRAAAAVRRWWCAVLCGLLFVHAHTHTRFVVVIVAEKSGQPSVCECSPELGRGHTLGVCDGDKKRARTHENVIYLSAVKLCGGV